MLEATSARNVEKSIVGVPGTSKIKATWHKFHIPLFKCIVNNCFILQNENVRLILVSIASRKKKQNALISNTNLINHYGACGVNNISPSF